MNYMLYFPTYLEENMEVKIYIVYCSDMSYVMFGSERVNLPTG